VGYDSVLAVTGQGADMPDIIRYSSMEVGGQHGLTDVCVCM